MSIRHLLFLSTLFVASVSSAQDLKSGYFIDNYLYRHDMNPAFGNEKNYIAVPVLGNVNVNLRGNVGVSDILYKVDGRTALFLNPKVSTAEFDKNINDNNKLTEDVKVQILGAGFKAFGGYNTFEINACEALDAHVPGSVLKAAKDGLTNQTYDFSNIDVNAQAYAEIALGHSHQINEHLRIGAKLKFLVGLANVDMNLKKAVLTLDENNYTAVVDAEIQSSLKEVQYAHETNERTGHTYVSGVDNTKWGIAGFGVGVDLGAEYKLDNWDFSAAILNLGSIRYSSNYTASTDGEKSVETDKYSFNIDEDAVNSFENEGNKLKDDLSTLYELDDKGDTGSRTRALGATLNLGVKYTLPSYDKLSFGLMNTTSIRVKYSWTDFRLSANYHPIKCLALSANLSAGSFGFGFGWMLDVQAKKGIDFFIGMDATPGKLAKQGIPLSSNAQISAGINVPL